MLRTLSDNSLNSRSFRVNRGGSNRSNQSRIVLWHERHSRRIGRHASPIHACHLERAARRLFERVPALLEGVVGLRRQADVDLAASQSLLETRHVEASGRAVTRGLVPEIDPAPGWVPG